MFAKHYPDEEGTALHLPTCPQACLPQRGKESWPGYTFQRHQRLLQETLKSYGESIRKHRAEQKKKRDEKDGGVMLAV